MPLTTSGFKWRNRVWKFVPRPIVFRHCFHGASRSSWRSSCQHFLFSASQFVQGGATEHINECGFHVKNIEDKRLGAEVMYLRFHQWHRRPNSKPNSKSSKPARRGRGRPDYMSGRPPSCEHCSQCFRGGSLAITCPFNTCGNLHWTCLRPHAEQSHGRLLRNAFRNHRKGRLSTAEELRRVVVSA